MTTQSAGAALHTALQIHLTRWSGQQAPEEERSALIGQIDAVLAMVAGDASPAAGRLHGALEDIRGDLVAQSDPQWVGVFELRLFDVPEALRALGA